MLNLYSTQQPYHRLIFVISLMLSLLSNASQAKETIFSKQSAETQTVLIELFTSQGCSSCPPADKWLSSLKQSGYSTSQVIPLALHVNYWDYIGWKDHFAQEQFGQRQAKYVQLNRAVTAYTPQIMVNGNDLRSKTSFDEFIKATNKKPASVSFDVTARLNDNALKLEINFDELPALVENTSVILAITEDGLSSKVSRGENSGHTLKHNHVTRVFKNISSPKTQLQNTLLIDKSWSQNQLSLIIFLQKDNGEILQALSLDLHD